MFSKPLDPRLKSKIYDSLCNSPESTIYKLRDVYLKDIKSGSFEPIKEVIRVLKYMIKDKITAMPKFYALLLIKEFMATEKKIIVEHFIKKLMNRFFLIAQFEHKNPDIKRGQRCLKKYFDSAALDNLEFSQKFFMLLLECWKHWDWMFSSEYKKIRDKAEKLRSLFPSNDLYYNHLDDGLMQETENQDTQNCKIHINTHHPKYGYSQGVNHESINPIEQKEESDFRTSLERTSALIQLKEESLQGVEKLLIEAINEGKESFSIKIDELNLALDNEIIRCHRQIMSSSSRTKLNIDSRTSLAKKIDTYNNIHSLLSNFQNQLITFDELKHSIFGDPHHTNNTTVHLQSTNPHLQMRIEDDRSHNSKNKLLSIENPPLVLKSSPSSRRPSKREIEIQENRSRKSKNQIKDFQKIFEGQPLEINTDWHIDHKDDLMLTTAKSRNELFVRDTNAKLPTADSRKKRTNSAIVKSKFDPFTKETVKPLSPSHLHKFPEWVFNANNKQQNHDNAIYVDDKNREPNQDDGSGGFVNFQFPQYNHNVEDQAHACDKPIHVNDDKNFQSTISDEENNIQINIIEPEQESQVDPFNNEFENQPFNQGFEEKQEQFFISDAFHVNPRMTTIHEESKDDYDESRKSQSRFNGNNDIFASNIRSSNQLEESKQLVGSPEFPMIIKFDDLNDFESKVTNLKYSLGDSNANDQMDNSPNGGRIVERMVSRTFEDNNLFQMTQSDPFDSNFSENQFKLQPNETSKVLQDQNASAEKKSFNQRKKSLPKSNLSPNDNDLSSKQNKNSSMSGTPSSKTSNTMPQASPFNAQNKRPSNSKTGQGKKNVFAKHKDFQIIQSHTNIVEVNDYFNAKNFYQNDCYTPQNDKASFFENGDNKNAKSQVVSPYNNKFTFDQPNISSTNNTTAFDPFQEFVESTPSKFNPFESHSANKFPSPSSTVPLMNLDFGFGRDMEERFIGNNQIPMFDSLSSNNRKLSKNSIANTHRSKSNNVDLEKEMETDVLSPTINPIPGLNIVDLKNEKQDNTSHTNLDINKIDLTSERFDSLRGTASHRVNLSDTNTHLIHTFAKPKDLATPRKANEPQIGSRTSSFRNSDMAEAMKVENSFEVKINLLNKISNPSNSNSNKFDSEKLIKPNFNEKFSDKRLSDASKCLKIDPNECKPIKRNLLEDHEIFLKTQASLVNIKKISLRSEKSLNNTRVSSESKINMLTEQDFKQLRIQNDTLKTQRELLFKQLDDKDHQVALLKGYQSNPQTEKTDHSESEILESFESKLIRRKNQFLIRKNAMLIKANKNLVENYKQKNYKKLEQKFLYQRLNQEFINYTEHLKNELEVEKMRQSSSKREGVNEKLAKMHKEILDIRELQKSLVLEIKEQSTLPAENLPEMNFSKKGSTLIKEFQTIDNTISNDTYENPNAYLRRIDSDLLDLQSTLPRIRNYESKGHDLSTSKYVPEISDLHKINDPPLRASLADIKNPRVLYKNLSASVLPNLSPAVPPMNIKTERNIMKNKSFANDTQFNEIQNEHALQKSANFYKLIQNEVQARTNHATSYSKGNILNKTNPILFRNSKPTASLKTLHSPALKPLTLRSEVREKIQPLVDHDVSNRLPTLSKSTKFPSLISLRLPDDDSPSMSFLKFSEIPPAQVKMESGDIDIHNYIDLRYFPLYSQSKNIILLKACSLFNKSLIYENDVVKVFFTSEKSSSHSSNEIIFTLTYTPKSLGYSINAQLENQTNFTATPKAYINKPLVSEIQHTVTYQQPKEIQIIDFPSLNINLRKSPLKYDIKIPLPFSINKFVRKVNASKDIVTRYLQKFLTCRFNLDQNIIQSIYHLKNIFPESITFSENMLFLLLQFESKVHCLLQIESEGDVSLKLHVHCFKEHFLFINYAKWFVWVFGTSQSDS